MATDSFWQNRIVGRAEVPPAGLIPHPQAWRQHPVVQRDALLAMLDEVGWVQAVIVSHRSGYMLDGGLRRDAALQRRQELVPVVYVDVTEDEERLILAALDPIAGLASTDEKALSSLLADLKTESPELRALVEACAVGPLPDAMDSEALNDAGPLPTDPVTCPGDLWACGEHRILCGDSTRAEDVDRLLDGEQARWLWTDPPYGVNYQGGTQRRLTIANDVPEGLPELLHEAFACADQALAPGAPVYVAHPAGALSLVFGAAFQEAGWHLHQTLVWLKDSLVLGRSDYQYRHEPVLYGWKGAKRPWHGGRNQTSVFEFPRPKRSPEHPTQKPVELVEAQLRNSSSAGDLGYDPFCGSGTTLIAAHRLGRRAAVMELSPEYVDVAVRRWERLSGGHAVLEGSGRTFAEVRDERHGG